MTDGVWVLLVWSQSGKTFEAAYFFGLVASDRVGIIPSPICQSVATCCLQSKYLLLSACCEPAASSAALVVVCPWLLICGSPFPCVQDH